MIDYATAVRVHGDQIMPERSPGPALEGRGVDEVLAAARQAAVTQGFTSSDRVLSSAGWDTADDLVAHLLAVYAVGASLVQVANPDPGLSERRRATEKVTKGCPAPSLPRRRKPSGRMRRFASARGDVVPR